MRGQQRVEHAGRNSRRGGEWPRHHVCGAHARLALSSRGCPARAKKYTGCCTGIGVTSRSGSRASRLASATKKSSVRLRSSWARSSQSPEMQLHADPRKLLDETRRRRSQERIRRVRATPDRHAPGALGRMTDRLALEFVRHAQQVAGAFDVQPAKIGGHDPDGGTQEQAVAEPALEVLDAAGKRRLADVQGGGRPHETAVLGQGDDLAQLLEFKCHASRIYLRYQTCIGHMGSGKPTLRARIRWRVPGTAVPGKNSKQLSAGVGNQRHAKEIRRSFRRRAGRGAGCAGRTPPRRRHRSRTSSSSGVTTSAASTSARTTAA